jgi:hypothetical protein
VALRSLAERWGVSVASLVREAVDTILRENDPLLDIIGLVEGGPSDLSEDHDEYLVRWTYDDSRE